MKLGKKGNALIAAICALLAIVSTTRAASQATASHATNFLDALYREVTNRVATSGTNITAKQHAALNAASKILGRNTKTLSADLSALATASTVLDTRFHGDATLLNLETNALDAYSDEAEFQLETAAQRVGTNSISRGLSNQLVKAFITLTNANRITNNVPRRARALAQAFNKMRVPLAQIERKFPTPPPPPFEAPTAIATGQAITLTETAPSPSETTTFYFHTTANTGDRYLNYTSDNPEEVGTWTYDRDGANPRRAFLHCNANFTAPGGATPPFIHDMTLTFTSASSGTFTGVNCFNESLTGTFVLVQ